MTDHDAEVAAVLAEVPTMTGTYLLGEDDAKVVLTALSAAGIRCLYVAEGVEVEHGARLVDTEYSGHRWPNGQFGRIHDRNSVHMDGCISFYAVEPPDTIEDTP